MLDCSILAGCTGLKCTSDKHQPIISKLLGTSNQHCFINAFLVIACSLKMKLVGKRLFFEIILITI